MINITQKCCVVLKTCLLFVIIFSCIAFNSFAQQGTSRENSLMVQEFYEIHNKPLYWFLSGKKIRSATEWINAIESADKLGFVSDKRQIGQIRTALNNKNKIDNKTKGKADRQITALVLDFIKYLQQGNIHFEYDEVSVPHDSVYVFQLLNLNKTMSVSEIISKFDCKDPDYMVLKNYLHDSIPEMDSVKYKSVLFAMNYRRYLAVNHYSEYVLVNIPSTEAEYFRNDLLVMKMRTVVGKKSKPTPTIASYITSIVTFPAWNVPYEIAVKELLPKVQRDESYLEQNNFDLVDSKGNLIDDSELHWKDYNEKNFPYYFRQSTGSDNSLGVLKFNLQNPFSIFLHATSWQGAFAKDFRFLSHGCIRLEKPVELANTLLRGNLDKKELKNGKKDTESNTIMLPNKIPVFIIYMPVTVVDNNVTFLTDVYELIK